MSEPQPEGPGSPAPTSVRRAPWWLVIGLTAGLIAVIALAFGGLSILAPPVATPAAAKLVPQSELDRRWGSYLSEREWGTPREAVGPDGWGLNWTDAIAADYRFGDDGIAGMTDADGMFRFSWAFWDGLEPRVTERFAGYTNPQGPAGEAITDDRIFRENSPTHAYQRLTVRYPTPEPSFRIELEAARYDATSMTLVATVTNTSPDAGTLDVVLKAWTSSDSNADPITDGLILRGPESVVTVVGQEPSDWQITSDKAALDANLRGDGLVEDQGGNIGALLYRLELPANGQSVIRFGVAEAALSEAESPTALETAATNSAHEALAASESIVTARRDENADLFADDVTEHEPVYRAALMSLLWNESYYRWDGTTGVNPSWAGRVDARDVLIMPDKWEYPWLASWDTAFHAVSASLVDPQIAQDQLRFVLSDRWQQPDGHIPCGEWVMDEECPPIFAWAAWQVYQADPDLAFLEAVYPGLQANYEYWWAHKRVGDALFTGGFLGMDNLPRGGAGQPQADASGWMAMFARDMAVIASELRDATTSGEYWLDRGLIQEQINARLWDDTTGFYYDLNANGGFLRQKSYSGLVPLIAGVVPAERLPPILAALRDEEQFLSVGGIRSVSADSPLYRPGSAGHGANSNWLGPVWLPINYLLVHALAEPDPELSADIRQRLVTNVETDWEQTSRFHEFFDGDTGEGLGADFQAGWTALVANLIREGWPVTPRE